MKSHAKTRTGLVAALDIGTTKTCCFIAEIMGDGKPRIMGIGHQMAHGVRGGVVIDMEAAEASIRATVHAAEQMAGQTISSVLVNISGGAPTSQTLGHEILLNGRVIGDPDLRKLIEQSQLFDELSERELIHAIPVGFSIDGNRGIRDPRGMYGERLGVHVHQITAASGPVRNLTQAVARCHLDVEALVVSPYASGLSSLVEDEMDLGVTLIDMGGGTTSIAVFFDGAVVFTDTIPIGGNHVTQDLARGLSTATRHAERMKTLYGAAIPAPGDDRDMIEVPLVGEEDPPKTTRISRSILVSIIAPRLEETFELVRGRLEAGGFDKLGGSRLVLTGGACQLPGVRELAGQIMDKRVRIGRPVRCTGLAESTGGPAFSTCIGLLNFATVRQPQVAAHVARNTDMPSGFISRIGSWFREAF